MSQSWSTVWVCLQFPARYYQPWTATSSFLPAWTSAVSRPSHYTSGSDRLIFCPSHSVVDGQSVVKACQPKTGPVGPLRTYVKHCCIKWLLWCLLVKAESEMSGVDGVSDGGDVWVVGGGGRGSVVYGYVNMWFVWLPRGADTYDHVIKFSAGLFAQEKLQAAPGRG